MNEITHDEENSSEAEDDTPQEQNLTEMLTYEKAMGKTTYKIINS